MSRARFPLNPRSEASRCKRRAAPWRWSLKWPRTPASQTAPIFFIERGTWIGVFSSSSAPRTSLREPRSAAQPPFAHRARTRGRRGGPGHLATRLVGEAALPASRSHRGRGFSAVARLRHGRQAKDRFRNRVGEGAGRRRESLIFGSHRRRLDARYLDLLLPGRDHDRELDRWSSAASLRRLWSAEDTDEPETVRSPHA